MGDLTDQKGAVLQDNVAKPVAPGPSLAKQILTIIANALVEIAKVVT
jgi:hypothetical protein